jgi:hypothetical protein
VARRGALRTARASDDRRAPIARRSDSRHRPFRAAHGSGQALHAASSARSTISGTAASVSRYAALSPDERVDALARLTRLQPDSLAAAIHHRLAHRASCAVTRSRFSKRHAAKPS